MNIVDKPFDELIFIETDRKKCSELEDLRRNVPDRNIRIENVDANKYLANLQRNWRKWRGVLFLDPFGAQVDWDTVQAIAEYKALDTWILFPTSTIARMLPTLRIPDDISPQWANRLTKVYGNNDWRNLYRKSEQQELFEDRRTVRNPGVEGLLGIYKNRLKDLFGDRFLKKSKTFTNSRGSPLFEFMFCVGSDNPPAIVLAKNIADHLLDSTKGL